MSRRKRRKSMADRPVTRRYVARVVERARQDIIGAIVMASYPVVLDARPEPSDPMMYLDEVERRLSGGR